VSTFCKAIPAGQHVMFKDGQLTNVTKRQIFVFGQEQFVTLPRCGRVCYSARRREERKVEL
jgi:hypothetical protein